MMARTTNGRLAARLLPAKSLAPKRRDGCDEPCQWAVFRQHGGHVSSRLLNRASVVVPSLGESHLNSTLLKFVSPVSLFHPHICSESSNTWNPMTGRNATEC